MVKLGEYVDGFDTIGEYTVGFDTIGEYTVRFGLTSIGEFGTSGNPNIDKLYFELVFEFVLIFDPTVGTVSDVIERFNGFKGPIFDGIFKLGNAGSVTAEVGELLIGFTVPGGLGT